MIWLSCDPGLRSGAWAAIDHAGGFVACGDIPAVGDRIDARRLMTALQSAAPPGDTAQIIIEDVWVMPKQGSVSSAGFMRATGAIEAVASLMWPVTLVRPQVWKRHHSLIGLPKSADLALARQTWPTAPLKLVKDHGKADALLMAQWGLETLA